MRSVRLFLTAGLLGILAACGGSDTESDAAQGDFAASTTPGLKATVKATQSWGSGFQGEATITNTTGSEIKGWELKFKLNGNASISGAWGAASSATKGGDGTWTLVPNSWGGETVPANGSVTISFGGSGGDFSGVSGCTINGYSCDGIALPPVDPPTKPPVDPPTKPPVDPPTNPGDKKVIGYFAEWGVYGRNYHIKNIETSGSANKLTHLNYAFGNVVGGRCQLGDTYADYDRAYSAAESVDGVADTWDTGALRGSFNQLKKLKAKHPGLKVMISLGGWSWSAGFSDAAMPGTRASFVQSCVDLFIKDARWAGLFDGIDIDWEYPGSCGLTCANKPEDTQNFTALLSEFRSQLNGVRPGLLLSIAAPADPAKIAKIQAGAVAQSLDFVNIMTYDMHGAWENTTNFHSPLFNSPSNPAKSMQFSTDEAVAAWKSGGAPASKLVVGVPFYGRGWTGVTNANNGLWQSASGGAPGAYEVGIEDYKVLKAKGHPGFTHQDTKAYYTFNGTEFWSYDTPASMATKMQYIKDNSLGGAMFWELSGDTSDGELITAVSNGLR